MRKKKTKKKKLFTSVKFKSCFFLLMGIITIFILLVFLVNHLFKIQVPERLRYIKDYKEFALVMDPIKECSNEVYTLFQKGDVIFNGVCIREVYVLYGKETKAPLKLVLDNDYITLNDIIKKLNNVDEIKEDISHYVYERSEITNGNYYMTVAPKEYQNVEITEVTFENYFESKEVVEEENIQNEVYFSGVVEIEGEN